MEDPFLLLRLGQLDRLKELIELNKVNVHQTRWSGFTLLHRAAEVGCTEMCIYLARKGLAVNLRTAKGWHTPLHIALGNGYFETAMALVDLGADPFRRNKNNETPFDFGGKRGFKSKCDEFRMKVSKKEITKLSLKFLSESKESI